MMKILIDLVRVTVEESSVLGLFACLIF